MLGPIFGLTLLTGFVFIIIWAARFATKHQLISALSWFLAIGIIGTLLSATLSGFAVRHFSNLRPGPGNVFMMGGGFRDVDDADGWFGRPRASSSAISVQLKK
ncbi:MAG: hypothetical protein PHX87_01905 [Candidatus Peribacteraceae bacterium]|nr:hypothetical protein [Candidatus Peribacteraceae bacterium]MDD5742161.1 hypothetical protein [Candidatus Peribacteraceae bacterium]